MLWLSDNYLTSIEDVNTLTRLRDLNLARNDISAIGDRCADGRSPAALACLPLCVLPALEACGLHLHSSA